MTKRYFTSTFSSLSIAVLMYEMGIFSIMQVLLCSPQKSGISCVSLITPVPLPPTYHRAASYFQLYTNFAFRFRNLYNWYKLTLARIWGISKHISFLLSQWTSQKTAALQQTNKQTNKKAKKIWKKNLGLYQKWGRMSGLTNASLEFPPSWACHLVSKYSGMDPKEEKQRLCQLCNQLFLLQPAQIATYPNTCGSWVLLHWHQACHICRFWVPLHWYQADHNVQIMSSVALRTSISYRQIMNSVTLASSIHWQSFGHCSCVNSFGFFKNYLHLLWVFTDNELISSQNLESFLLFAGGGAEDSHCHTKGFPKLDSHVT